MTIKNRAMTMNRFFKYIYAVMTIVILNNCSEDSIDLTETETGTLTGTVVADGTNEPFENVRISTTPSSSEVFTDENGEFIINDIPVDDYSVQAELEGFLTGFEGATITEGNITNVVIDLRTDDSDNQSPTMPILIAPADNELDTPVEVELMWSASDPDDDELDYTIELRNNIDDEVLTFNTTANDTTQVVSDLRFGLRYFWQVSVTDNIIDTPVLSAVSVFETVDAPENNRITYVRQMGSNNVIFSVDENGENEFQLTDLETNSFRPRRNIAAERIAFLSNVGSETHIFTIEPNGSNVTQITSTIPVNGFNLNEVDFTWTQGGGRLLYPNFDRLYAINNDGTGLEQIYQTIDGSFITEVAISNDESRIVLKTNDAAGYNVAIFTIDNAGNIIDDVLSGVPGAAGGLDISVDNQSVLYWYDVSGFESSEFRQLDSRIFLFDVPSSTTIDLSDDKELGTNDFDCRFTPNEAEIIIVNTSNDGISQRDILIIDTDPNATGTNRNIIIEDAEMVDFE